MIDSQNHEHILYRNEYEKARKIGKKNEKNFSISMLDLTSYRECCYYGAVQKRGGHENDKTQT